jgi:putative transposase
MDDYESLSHTTWTCKYHVVFIPKGRRKALYLELRRHLGEVFRKLALQRESKVEEGHLMPDHVHMLLSVPPKYAVSQVVGYIKGKSAIHLARVYAERKRNFVGQHSWARGYFVNTVGRDEDAIRAYVRKGGPEARTVEPLALTMPPLAGSKLNGPRQRPVLPL